MGEMIPKINMSLHLLSQDESDIEDLNLSIQNDLKSISGLEYRLFTKESPEHTKSPGGIDWSSIMLTAIASGSLLSTIVNAVQSHLSRDRKVIFEIDGDRLELTGISSQTQNELIKEWIMFHSKKGKKGNVK